VSGILLYVGTAGFTQDDLPEEMPLGGKQSYVQRQFPGGNVQVQTLGGFDDDITWSGEFFGPNAWSRAQAIDKYRISGQEVLIKYKSITKYGIVSSFKPTYMNNGRVPYTITITPTRNANSMASVGSTPVHIHTSSIKSTSVNTTSSKHTQPATRSKTYTIKRGDTLWGIAYKEYGKGSLWTKIKAANPKIVPTDLKTGTKINIP
jgi:nucleoid-associated protein YgaU